MGRLVVSEFITLDGIFEAPGLEEHQAGRNAWALKAMGDDAEDHNRAQTLSASAYLLGRRTYQIWAAFWPTATGDEAFSRKMNEVPKYVISRTLDRADWNTTIVRDVVPEEVMALKAQPGGDLTLGGADLAAAFMRHGLVDEYRIYVHPVLIGQGKPLFPPSERKVDLRLVETRAFGNGVVLLRYEA